MAELNVTDINLPYNLDAEQTVLGSLIVDPELMTKVSGKLTAEHFHISSHQGIFKVLQRLFVSTSDIADINIVTIEENCIRDGILDSAEETRAYLFKLADKCIERSSIDSYVEVLDDKFLMRRLITASNDILDKAYSGTEESAPLLDYAEKVIFDIRDEREIKGLVHVGNILRGKIKELAFFTAHPEEAKKKGTSTGFPSLDQYTSGLNPSDLIVLAARPGMGKTSFAINIAVNVARMRRDKKVAIFSLEMSSEQIVSRMISSEARIDSKTIQDGLIPPSQWRSLNEAAEMLSTVELYVDDTPGITVGEMKAKLRRMPDLGLVVIDYLQLMSTGRRDGNRVNEISELTRNIKILAKELNVPVILLSQLTRSAEKRDDKKPMLSDLRESGSIEQDADIVLFLLREAYYDDKEADETACVCTIAKNRHGSTGKVNLRWDGQYTRFSDVEQRYENKDA